MVMKEYYISPEIQIEVRYELICQPVDISKQNIGGTVSTTGHAGSVDDVADVKARDEDAHWGNLW